MAKLKIKLIIESSKDANVLWLSGGQITTDPSGAQIPALVSEQ